MRDETFFALLDVLPIVGSVKEGYRISEHVGSHVVALPEEWTTAAFEVLWEYYWGEQSDNEDRESRAFDLQVARGEVEPP